MLDRVMDCTNMQHRTNVFCPFDFVALLDVESVGYVGFGGAIFKSLHATTTLASFASSHLPPGRGAVYKPVATHPLHRPCMQCHENAR